MKLKNIKQVQDFLKAVDKCKGGVYLTSQYGDKYNLNSNLSQYVAIAALLGEHGDELEIWCDYKEDEVHIVRFLREYEGEI